MTRGRKCFGEDLDNDGMEEIEVVFGADAFVNSWWKHRHRQRMEGKGFHRIERLGDTLVYEVFRFLDGSSLIEFSACSKRLYVLLRGKPKWETQRRRQGEVWLELIWHDFFAFRHGENERKGEGGKAPSSRASFSDILLPVLDGTLVDRINQHSRRCMQEWVNDVECGWLVPTPWREASPSPTFSFISADHLWKHWFHWDWVARKKLDMPADCAVAWYIISANRAWRSVESGYKNVNMEQIIASLNDTMQFTYNEFVVSLTRFRSGTTSRPSILAMLELYATYVMHNGQRMYNFKSEEYLKNAAFGGYDVYNQLIANRFFTYEDSINLYNVLRKQIDSTILSFDPLYILGGCPTRRVIFMNLETREIVINNKFYRKWLTLYDGRNEPLSLIHWIECFGQRLNENWFRIRKYPSPQRVPYISLYPRRPDKCSVCVTRGVEVMMSYVFTGETFDDSGYSYSISLRIIPEGEEGHVPPKQRGFHVIQLLSRSFRIQNIQSREVEYVNGAGVIGKTPYLIDRVLNESGQHATGDFFLDSDVLESPVTIEKGPFQYQSFLPGDNLEFAGSFRFRILSPPETFYRTHNFTSADVEFQDAKEPWMQAPDTTHFDVNITPLVFTRPEISW